VQASNYKELVALHDKYKDKGLEVIAWPCNQFGKQESGSPEAICKFTAGKGVTFPVMEKIDVNGPNTHRTFILSTRPFHCLL
jgi:glutathione peroxidase-family protein